MKKQALIYIFLASLGWGMSGVFVHFLTPYGYSSLHMTGARALVSFACLLLYTWIKDKEAFKIRPRELLIFLFTGCGLYGTAAFYFTAMQLSSVSTAVVLMYSAPVLVMIFSVLFLGEKMTAVKAVAVGLVFAGCILVSGAIGDWQVNPLGILFGILSSVAYAAYNILTKISMRRGSDPTSANIYVFMTASAISLVFSDPVGAIKLAGQAPAVLIPLLVSLGLVTFFLPYMLYTLAMKSLPAGVASSLAILEPMIATIISVAFFREKLDIAKSVGIICILVAVFLLGRSKE